MKRNVPEVGWDLRLKRSSTNPAKPNTETITLAEIGNSLNFVADVVKTRFSDLFIDRNIACL